MSHQVIQPFLRPQKQFTMIHNYVIDVIMPSLSPNAWRLLCFIMRHTIGKPDGDRFSYPELMKGSGIKSPATLSTALKELADRSFVNKISEAKWKAAIYSLNTEYAAPPASETEVRSTSKSEVSTSKIEAVPTSKSEVPPTSKSEVHLLIHDLKTCNTNISARFASQRQHRNKFSSRDPRTDLPAIQAYLKVTGRYPPKELYDEIISLLGRSPDMARLTKCWIEASKRSLNHRKDIWLFDWYPNGIQEGNRNGQSRIVGHAAPKPGKYDHLS